MDPFSRRKVFELLSKEKEQRTIVLTTHFMEEAELLADEICMLVNGRVRCHGTAIELKSTFGIG
jgi:ATP-binding cassette subfamily A (ABC1) protein 3